MIPGETILSGAKVDKHISPFQVLRANSYYIGTTFTTCDGTDCDEKDCKDMGAGMEMPNTRETGYFNTRSEAEEALKAFLLGDMTDARLP
jgi:hypothetical protein